MCSTLTANAATYSQIIVTESGAEWTNTDNVSDEDGDALHEKKSTFFYDGFLKPSAAFPWYE